MIFRPYFRYAKYFFVIYYAYSSWVFVVVTADAAVAVAASSLFAVCFDCAWQKGNVRSSLV